MFVFVNMQLEDMDKDINTAFEKLKITSGENEGTIGDYSHFKPLILSAINNTKKKKKRAILSMTT